MNDNDDENVENENVQFEFDSVGGQPFPNFVQRYFKQFYKTDMEGKASEDHYIFQHVVGLCVIGIAPSHPIRTKKLKIKNFEFTTSKTNQKARNDHKLKGKKKKGGITLQSNTALCTVTLEDDTSYTIRACIKGTLLEVNDNLLKNPNLLLDDPESAGHVAVIQPHKSEEEFASFLNYDSYCKLRNQ